MNDEPLPSVDAKLDVESTSFAKDDDRWLDQMNLFVGDLREAVPVRQEVVTQPGKKGGAESVILALGSAGAITAVVQVIRAWLARDRTRKIKLTIGNVVLEGSDIQVGVINEVLRTARKPLEK